MEKIPNELTEEQKLQTSPEITNETPVEGEEVQTPVEETPQTDTGEVDNAVEETIPTPPHQPEEDSEEEPEVLTAEVEEEKEYVIPDTHEGIISRLNTLADNAEQSEKAELDLLKQVFYKRIKEEKAKKYAEFINGGGKEEEFQLQPNPLEDEFKKIMTIIKDQRNKMMMAIEKQKELNLEKKKAIIEKIKELSTSPEDANKAYETIRTLQNEWKDIKPIPASAANEIWKSYQVVVEQYYDLLKTNNALRDYDYKKNLEAKTKLCEEAEALNDDPDIIHASRILQELHQEFREIGPVTKDLRESLWNRFKAASSAVNKRHAQYFEQIKEKEEENLKKKTEICEKIEAVETANLQNFTAWDNLSKQILEWQAEWKAIGHATKKMNNKIYERFRAACDNFFSKKANFFKEQRKTFAENTAKKIALCEKAEALQESTAWNKTTDAIIQLQKEWKEIGPVAHKTSVSLWERFNTACNAFFDNKKKTLGDQRKEEQENLNKKKSIIDQLKALVETDGENIAEQLKELQANWNSIGHVPFKSKDKVYDAYRAACDELYNKFNLRTRRTNSSRPSEKLPEGNSLFRLYESKKNELNTYENNFSFLSSNSKKGNALIDSMQKKIANLKEEVADILQKLKEEQAAQKKTEDTSTEETITE